MRPMYSHIHWVHLAFKLGASSKTLPAFQTHRQAKSKEHGKKGEAEAKDTTGTTGKICGSPSPRQPAKQRKPQIDHKETENTTNRFARPEKRAKFAPACKPQSGYKEAKATPRQAAASRLQHRTRRQTQTKPNETDKRGVAQSG